MLTSRVTRGAIVAAAAALALIGLATTPALATAAPATLQVRVVDSATEQPVAGIEVLALSQAGRRGSYVDFGATDSNGAITRPAGGFDHSDAFTAGTWNIYFEDQSSSRYRAGTDYAGVERKDVAIEAGLNDLGQQPLAVGGTVSGTARTPSGHPLTNLSYLIESPDTDQSELLSYFGGATEAGDATFEQTGLPVSTYEITYDASANGFGTDDGPIAYRPGASFEISEPGQHVTADLSVRVDATHKDTTLAATSPARATARLVFKIANSFYDITDPGGVVTVMSAQGKTIGDPVPVEEVNGHGKATITFPATTGTHTYRAYYSSTADHPADLRSTSRTVKVAVR